MGSVRGCGIRGRGERAVKSQVVPFPAFRCRLRNVSFLSLGKKEKVSAADVERQMWACSLLPCRACVPSYTSFLIWNMLVSPLSPCFAWFYIRKLSRAPLAAGRVVGLSASGEGQRQSQGTGAWFGNQGWDPRRAVQAAQWQGQVSSIRSSPVWKPLIGTPKKPQVKTVENVVCNKNKLVLNFYYLKKKGLLFPWPAHFIKIFPLNKFCHCNLAHSQDMGAVSLPGVNDLLGCAQLKYVHWCTGSRAINWQRRYRWWTESPKCVYTQLPELTQSWAFAFVPFKGMETVGRKSCLLPGAPRLDENSGV